MGTHVQPRNYQLLQRHEEMVHGEVGLVFNFLFLPSFASLLSPTLAHFPSLDWYEPGLAAKVKEQRLGENATYVHLLPVSSHARAHMLAGGKIPRRRPTLLRILESVRLRSVAISSW